ncbi:MAG TPA: DHA2 family efflux MFS transporter permease subunit, partial [Negativicutes bacterium]
MKKYAVLCTVCLGTVLSAYVGNSVNLALPNIMAALNFNLDTIVWVSLGYLLPYGSTLPLTGKLGDQFGRKKMYIIGIVIFSVASLFCGLATSSAAMVIFRVCQGVGAGFLLPNAMAIVAETFDPQERGQALGIWSAMVAVGSAMGPTVGGYLIEKFDWRSIFFSVVPLCFISIGLALTVIPASKRNSAAAADYFGAFFLITSISVLLVALNQGQKEGWRSLYILMLFCLIIVAFVLFLMVEMRVKNPIIEFALFRNINFTVANVVGFLSFMALNGGTFIMPFFLKSMLHYSSSTAGLTLLPQTVAIVICAPIGGRLADRFGPRLPAFIGIMMISSALYLLNAINLDFSRYQFSFRMVLLGM